MSEPILFFSKDVGVALDFTIQNNDGTTKDITGDTVSLLVEGLGAFSCSLLDPTNGKVRKTVAAGEFPVGVYRAQLKDEEAGGNKLHSEIFKIQVSDTLI